LVHLGAAPNVLEQRAALADEQRRLARITAELEKRRTEVEAAAAELNATDAATRALRDRLAEARSARQTADEAARKAETRAEHSAREATWAAAQADQAGAEVKSLQLTIAEVEAQLAEDTSSTADDDAKAAPSAARRLSELRDRQRQLAKQVAAQRQRRQAAEEGRRRAEIGVVLDEQRLVAIDAEHERAIARRHQLDAELEHLALELSAADQAQRQKEAELSAALGEGADERRRLLGAERSAAEARERLRGAETRSRTAEVATMEARLHLEQLREQLLVELAGIGDDGLVALRPAGAAMSATSVADEPEQSAELIGAQLEEALSAASAEWQRATAVEPAPPSGRLSTLRRRFHELGAGNPFAVEEYAEVSQRLESLEVQRADLETAVANTRQLIADLSRLITEQFLATFAALEGAFARRFEQLFNGGEAQLSLTAPDDPTTTGVEITARPPGKKRQPLAMLSGGERALTAVALLLAMLEVRPVPFCVLDEVDAALDEANIARFAAALRGLADRIQFIVITHNRGTIETADALYGVTIGDDAVSRIISLRLAEADGSARGPQVEAVPVEPAVAEAAGG
jgi:chromosome segregation protein